MRIVSGRYGGRRLEVPKGYDIRPTSDKIRGAVFNILRSRIDFDDLTVMDIFCGTGALGIEALSQGAVFCIFVDNNRDSILLTQRNVEAVGARAEAKTLHKDAQKLSARPEDIAPADLVLLDPPYNKNLAPPALEALGKGGWLAPGALCVIEEDKRWTASLPEHFTLEDERLYGDTKIVLAAYQPSMPL